MSKGNLREHLEGNELDLSLNNLTTLPVKELAAIPKATHMDFSSNALVSIPPEFCQLTHIVRLDLSQNRLNTLPPNFGDLVKLQTLDLYNNFLTTLPVSFCQLRSLKWLDVKNNTLMEPLGRIAGDCLDDAQCKKCASKVVTYMTQVHQEQEIERARQLQQQQEREAAKKKVEEAELLRKRAVKKAAKEKRRREAERRRDEEEKRRRQEEEEASNDAEVDDTATFNSQTETAKDVQKGGLSCCGVFFSMIIGLMAVFAGLYFFCSTNPQDKSCMAGGKIVREYFVKAQRSVENLLSGLK